MPKKAVKSRKTSRVRKSKPSILSKLFTFPKLVVYGFVILSVLFVFQVASPSRDVKGASTSDDDIQLVTQSQVISQNLVPVVSAKLNTTEPASTGNTLYTVHQINIFVDNNPKNIAFDEPGEYCLGKSVVVYVDNGHKVRKFSVWGCSQPIRIKTKARTITVGLDPISGYKNTGVNYNDKNHTGAKIAGASKVKVTGFYTAGQYYTWINFGVKK